MKKINLTPSDQQVLQKFVTYLEASNPEKIEFVGLFGSKARGEDREDSDIDVLVILKQEDRKLRREILKQAARFSLEFDVLLSPRVIGLERWGQMRDFSLYRNIQQDAAGLEIIGGQLYLEPVQEAVLFA